MKKSIQTQKISTLFLRAAGLAVGSIAAIMCVFVFPVMWTEATKEFPDVTFVFYITVAAFYVATVPFFLALRQAFKLLSYVDQKKVFSYPTVRALRSITHNATAMSAILAFCLPFFYVWADNDDAPGLIVVGACLAAIPLTVAIFAGVLKRLFDEAIKIKSENDLTV